MRIQINKFSILGFLVPIFSLPLAYIIPKKRGLIVLMAGDGTRFVDNVKYMTIHLKDIADYYYISEDKHTVALLTKNDLKALAYPSIVAIWTYLRAQIVIMDRWSHYKSSWTGYLKYGFIAKAKKIQLWHGVGFKSIELEQPLYIECNKKMYMRLYFWALQRFPIFDYIITTSPFYVRQFKKSFHAKNVLPLGYPRNDRTLQDHDLAKINTCRIPKNDKKKILFVPTFRENGTDPLKSINMELLHKFAQENNYLIILKFHTNTGYKFNKYVKTKWSDNFFLYKPLADIYPLLKQIDLLITDYSSIYMDFLQFNKPIIFYAPDLKEYQTIDRPFICDYHWITPGPKVINQNDLHQAIIDNLKNDRYCKKRDKIYRLAFSNNGDAAPKIFRLLLKCL